jgi:hypothetical protein
MDDVERCRAWVDEVVVGLELCPFAAAPLRAGGVRWRLVDAEDIDDVVGAVLSEVLLLVGSDPGEVETTLVVTPGWPSFEAYLDLAGAVDAALELAGLVGEIQVVTFHPAFRFEGDDPEDPGNAVNRSPVPMLHLLRERDVEEALAAHPDPDGIPARNARVLRERAGWPHA